MRRKRGKMRRKRGNMRKKNGEKHSDPIYNNPIKNLPTRGGLKSDSKIAEK